MSDKDMREVVRRLHAENSAALLELLEFDYALDEFLRILEAHRTAAHELHLATRHIVASEGEDNFARDTGVQERAGRLNASAGQILAAFRGLHNAVRDWNIADARRPASKPSGPNGAQDT